MNEQKQILEQYLKAKFSDKVGLSITRLDKLRDGWESDNYLLTVEYGDRQTREDWVWRIYSGAGSQVKAAREFNGMARLRDAGYPVPRVFLLETDHSLVERPFIIMEYIQGEVMWEMIDAAPVDRQTQLLDQFCQLFVQLHDLDWKQFDDSLPDDTPFFFIEKWLDEARGVLQNFPEVDASPFLDWVAARRGLFACARPSPVHQDFHPGNILVNANDDATVIDWTDFDVTDSRFDLAWTLVLAYAYGGPELRNQILQGYQRYSGKPVEEIESFEVIACARRLFDLTVSLTQGAQSMGMNAQAVEAMRANMEAHRRVHHLFVERTRLQIEAFDSLFG
ncbi:MAG: phosphotransferase [Anaerolineales bacterium]|nr:phosphotransferase [Anaerolineales bacterium]